LRNDPHPIPNELLGGRGDATTARTEADNDIDAASGGLWANGAADVSGPCRASAPSSTRAEPAAKRTIAKETVG
jgi:hypothetical protein